MKKLMILLLFVPVALQAQVTKNVLIEHFTNTFCSVCASRNPGLYNNLSQFPQVIHISYYPSSPYPSCPLNQHNTADNDARTNFYGVYGSTPRIVIQGNVIPAASSYSDATLFNTQTGQTTAFEIKATMKAVQGNTALITSTVKKVSSSSLVTLELYGAIVEDTLFFTANNGETKHHDVFRKAIWGAQPISITAPVNIGDSTVNTQTITINSAWDVQKLYTVLILQESSKAVVQAQRSNYLSATLDITDITTGDAISLYPNPVNNTLQIKGSIPGNSRIAIYSTSGVMVKEALLSPAGTDISALSSGLYFVLIQNNEQRHYLKFVKQ